MPLCSDSLQLLFATSCYNFVVVFRGILLAEQQRYSEAVESYQHAIHFRPRLAGELSYPCSSVNKLIK